MILTTAARTRSPARPRPRILATIPRTEEQRLHRMEALGQRIAEYVSSMCKPGTPPGTSAEARERAVAAFYEELILVERQLGLVRDNHLLE